LLRSARNDIVMKLIFITRKIDRGDALTGFIFTWIKKLAGELEKLYVICQEKGDTSGLPGNVEIYSFGKERGFGKLRQGYQLLIKSYQLARRADGFFVHMHPIYAIITWLPAKLFGKKLILWYTHKSADTKLRIAHALADEVLTASTESFRIKSHKVKIVGHGIDLEKFIPSLNPSPQAGGKADGKFKILSIGRISPVKDYETLIKAIEILRGKGTQDIEVKIYGKIGLPRHQVYLDSLIAFIHNADLENMVKFEGEINYEFVPELYQEADLFVNLSQTGSIDKTVLEAAASEAITLTSNEAFAVPISKISPQLFFERNNPADLAEKILKIKSLNHAEKQKIRLELRKWVEEDHNLNNLVQRIVQEFKK